MVQRYPWNAHLLKLSAYGLPELHREEIKNAQIIGNPGCYPTCSILALAPLVKNRLVDTKNIIMTQLPEFRSRKKTDLPYQFCECDENFKAYSVSNHRHTSEIEQELSLLAEEEITVSFTPHLVPMKEECLQPFMQI